MPEAPGSITNPELVTLGLVAKNGKYGYQIVRKSTSAVSVNGRISVFHQAVMQRLAHPRLHSDEFDLAVANLLAISDREASGAIKIRAHELQEKICQVSEKWQAERAFSLPPHADLLFDHSLSTMQTDLN